MVGSGAEEWIILSSTAFKSPRDFMTFVGLDRPPVEPSSDDLNGKLYLCTCFLLIFVLLILADHIVCARVFLLRSNDKGY